MPDHIEAAIACTHRKWARPHIGDIGDFICLGCGIEYCAFLRETLDLTTLIDHHFPHYPKIEGWHEGVEIDWDVECACGWTGKGSDAESLWARHLATELLAYRQVARQIRLFLNDGNRDRLNVALALIEPEES